MDVLSSILWFIVAIGIIIPVHEFGHFWVARRLGVKVLRFSVGFGRALWSRRDRSGTEYVLAAVPLGGYVKMLDEREGAVPAHERAQAFSSKSLPVRSAVVAAGPLFNVLFAIAAFWVMFMTGIQELRPVIGEPEGPAAAAGFEAGDLITAVDGQTTSTWSRTAIALLDRSMSGEGSIRFQVETESGIPAERTVDVAALDEPLDETRLLRQLGFTPWRPVIPPVIDEVTPESAAAAAGLQAGDRVVEAADEAVEDWEDWRRAIESHPGEPFPVVVERSGGRVSLVLVPGVRTRGDAEVGFAGVAPRVPEGYRERLYTTERYGPLAALWAGTTEVWDVTALTFGMLGHMISGEASLKNLSGPISIAQYASDSARSGPAVFLRFLGILSVSIAILNVLPIPVLDGGHLLYYVIESIKGKPLSEQAQMIGQRIGLTFLFGLMALVFYNDILRLFSVSG